MPSESCLISKCKIDFRTLVKTLVLNKVEFRSGLLQQHLYVCISLIDLNQNQYAFDIARYMDDHISFFYFWFSGAVEEKRQTKFRVCMPTVIEKRNKIERECALQAYRSSFYDFASQP